MEKKVVEFYKFTKNFNKKFKKRYIPNIFPVKKCTTEAYYNNLINYYSNELAIKPVKK